MTTTRQRALLSALAAACLSALWLSWNLRVQAQEDRAAALLASEQVQQDLQQLAILRSQAALVDQTGRPADALATPIRTVLESFGLRPDTLSGVSVPAPHPIANGTMARQSAALTLSSIRTAELAQVLQGWVSAEPLWTVRGIRLDRTETGKQSGQLSDRFTAVVTLDNIYVSTSAARGPNPARTGGRP